MCQPSMDEEEKRPKRLDKNILDLFYKLCSKNNQLRIDSSVEILRSLCDKQVQVEKREDFSNDLKYCIERLVKGLGSSRDAARLGYALLLTEILKKFTAIEIEDVLQLITQHLSFTPKQEKRDVVFGQLFAYSSLVRSHRLANHSHLSFIFSNIFNLWQGRSYIVNACYEIIKDLLDQLTVDSFKKELWPFLKEKFSGGWEKGTADSLWLLFLCIRKFPEVVNEKYLKKQFNAEEIFSTENFDHLRKLIRQSTSCLPKIHPLCSEIVVNCSKRKDIKEIWIALVDENLFDGDQSEEKSFVGFEMVKFVLQSVQKKKIVKHVLSPKLCGLFARSYVNLKSPMNPASTQMAEYLSNYAKSSEDPEMQMLILKFFLQPPGAMLFDQLLKKKEISLFIQNLLPETVKIFCEFLKAIALKRKTSENDDNIITDNKRSIAVSQISNLISHAKIMTDIDWRVNVIKFLFLHSFFSVKGASSEILHCESFVEEIPSNIRESFKDAFYKTLTSFYQRTDQQTSPMQHSLDCLLLLVEYTDQLLTDTAHLCPLFPADQVQEPWMKMRKTIQKLQKQSKKDGKINESNAFLALFLELGFHLFHDSSIADVLEELHICCKKALSDRRHSNEQSVEENEPPWVGVVTDIMLSLLSKSSHHLRRLVTSVFHLLCPFITQEALQQILLVIHPEKSDEEPMLIDESDDENLNFESGSSSDESESNEPDDIKVDEKFRLKVKEALGDAADASDAESVVLSDTEMFKLDDALSEAFRERVKTGHTKMSTGDKTMLEFRLRCLDLVITYLKSEPPLSLVLQCIEPLLAAYEFSHRNEQQSHLLFKIVKTIDTMTKIKKFQHFENVGKSDLKNILEMLIEKCHKEINANVASKLYSLCVFMVLCFKRLQAHRSPEKKSSKTPVYLKMYLTALESFVKGSSHIFPQFYVSLVQSCPDTAWKIMEQCKTYAFNTDIRMYKRTQCLGLLSEGIKYSKAQSEITSDEWSEFCQSVLPKAVETLKQSLVESDIKPTYFTELLEVICACHSISKERTSKILLENYSDLFPLLENLSKQNQKRLTKKSKSLMKNLIKLFKGNTDSEKPKESNVFEAEVESSKDENGLTNEVESSKDKNELTNDVESNKDENELTKEVESSESSPRKRKSTTSEKKKKKFKSLQ